MQRFVRDFPEARTCPPDTLRRLREIDPKAEVLYLGPSPKGGKWLLGTMDPDAMTCRTAWRRLHVHLQRPPSKCTRDWWLRVCLERAKAQGFKPRTVYEAPEPDGDLVERVRFAHYDHQNTSDSEFFQQLDDAKEAITRANEADLTDPGRSKAAWKYWALRTHSFAAKAPERVRSGFQRAMTIPHAYSQTAQVS